MIEELTGERVGGKTLVAEWRERWYAAFGEEMPQKTIDAMLPFAKLGGGDVCSALISVRQRFARKPPETMAEALKRALPSNRKQRRKRLQR